MQLSRAPCIADPKMSTVPSISASCFDTSRQYLPHLAIQRSVGLVTSTRCVSLLQNRTSDPRFADLTGVGELARSHQPLRERESSCSTNPHDGPKCLICPWADAIASICVFSSVSVRLALILFFDWSQKACPTHVVAGITSLSPLAPPLTTDHPNPPHP
jgi:hypothetical protein